MSRPEIRMPSFGQFGTPRLQGTAIGAILLIIVILWIAVTSFFTVEPEEIGLVLRFGQFVRTTDPGLHFKFPTPLERVIKVPVQRQLKQEFGFRTETAGIMNSTRDEMFKQQGFTKELWVTAGDEVVREDHVTFGGAGPQDRDFNYMTLVSGGGLLRFPNDAAAPVGQVVNCRCIKIPVE